MNPPFHIITLRKLVIMTIVTFGFYDIYWFLANWSKIKRFGKSKLDPSWRTVFAILYIPSLFKTLKNALEERGIKSEFRPRLLATLAIILSLIAVLGQIASLGVVGETSILGISLYLIILLIPHLIFFYAQHLMNKVSAQEGFAIKSKFSAIDWIAIGFFVLLILATLVPIATVTVGN